MSPTQPSKAADGTTPRADVIADSAVNASLTAESRRRRPRAVVETMDYLSAARRFIRAAGKRVGDGDEVELRALLDLARCLDDAIYAAVVAQQQHGASWADIARATGTTRQAAHAKWGKR